MAGGCKKGKYVPVQAMNAYRWSRYTASLIPNFTARWRSVFNITHRPLYTLPHIPAPREGNARYRLNARLGGAQRQSGRTGEEESLLRIKKTEKNKEGKDRAEKSNSKSPKYSFHQLLGIHGCYSCGAFQQFRTHNNTLLNKERYLSPLI